MKYAWIEEHRDQFSLTRMCRLLAVSRSGYCQWRTRAPSDRSRANAALDAQVAAIHAASKRSYGRDRIARRRTPIMPSPSPRMCLIGVSMAGLSTEPGWPISPTWPPLRELPPGSGIRREVARGRPDRTPPAPIAAAAAPPAPESPWWLSCAPGRCCRGRSRCRLAGRH